MNQQLINWLLDFNEPSLKYRVLTDLLDYKHDNPEIIELEKQIPDSTAVKKILERMHPDGYWLQTNPRTKVIAGDGVKYGAFASTHYCLSYLSELGLTKENPIVAKAAERYLNLQKEDGDFWLHMSCLSGYNLLTFIRFGYREDKRVQKTIDLMLNTERNDGGYLCEMHEKRSKKKKSCVRGAAKVLMAFAELPEYWQHPRCLDLVNYFLSRNAIYNSKLTGLVSRDMKGFSFPMTWGTNIWEILLALSKMGYGKDKRLNDAWELLESKKNNDGTYNLDHTPSQSPWKVGNRGMANPWLTFYILLAKKFRDSIGR